MSDPTPHENAVAALDAYEASAFPDYPAGHRGEPAGVDAALRGLLTDLMAYADRCGVDFNQALTAAAQVYDDEIAEACAYAKGDEVRLRFGDGRSGTVTAVRDDDIYQVHVPGEKEPRLLRPVELEDAEPFAVALRGGPVSRAQDAEKLLVDLGVRIYAGEHDGPPPDVADYTERDTLAAALAGWSGTPQAELQRALGPRIVLAYADTVRPITGRDLGPGPLAFTGFPHDITQGVQPAEPGPNRTIPHHPGQQQRPAQP